MAWYVTNRTKAPRIMPTSPITFITNALRAASTAERRWYQKPIRRYERSPTRAQPTIRKTKFPARTSSSAAGPGRELRLPDRRLGPGRAPLVPPDRLLVPAPLGSARRAQGVRDERDRRRRHDPRRLRPVRDVPRHYLQRRVYSSGRTTLSPAGSL